MTENGKKNQQGKTAKDLVEHTDNHSIKPTPGERANNLKVLEDLPAEVRRIVSMTSLQGGRSYTLCDFIKSKRKSYRQNPRIKRKRR